MFDSNKVFNGLYGKVFDNDGRQLDSTQSFEANVEFEKEEIIIPGAFMKGHKIMGANGSGSMNFLKLDSRLQRQIAENPTQKYNYIGKLEDPDAGGKESILFIGVSFDSAPLMNYEMGSLIEVDLDFTFDGYRYLDYVE